MDEETCSLGIGVPCEKVVAWEVLLQTLEAGVADRPK